MFELPYDIRYYEYLDELRESGITGDSPYLAKAFKIKESLARTILASWMETYGTRYSKPN